MDSNSFNNIFLIRHPESMANIDRSLCRNISDFDIDLSYTGYLQANNTIIYLSKYLHFQSSVSIYFSPFFRTRIFAENLKKALSIKIDNIKYQCDTRLSELSYGSIKGLTNDAWQNQYPENYRSYINSKQSGTMFFFTYPEGESLQTTYNRILDFKSKEIDKQNSPTVIISHNSPLKLLSLAMNNKSNLDYFKLNDLPYAGITHFSKNGSSYKEHGIIFNPQGY